MTSMKFSPMNESEFSFLLPESGCSQSSGNLILKSNKSLSPGLKKYKTHVQLSKWDQDKTG